ncbi:cupin domain-containing protein [Deinococcus ruber]|uniref:Cupin n=1 Tax=Deinococcus ruber TaxID=1848197 RepID=A0A918CF06_9DEIO|nr:cupin domain-containing protein [Deinococcus ruber]GGR18707.1 cupin [Deinococcus ruber]
MTKMNPNAAGKTLVQGERVALRLWSGEVPGTHKEMHTSPYETVGYVLQGRAEVEVNNERHTVGVGDTYLIPQGAMHTYHFLETFSAVEAISQPEEGKEA